MIRKPPPKNVDKVNWKKVYAMALEYVDECERGLQEGAEPVEYASHLDMDNHIMEAVIEAVFGKRVWKYVNQTPEEDDGI